MHFYQSGTTTNWLDTYAVLSWAAGVGAPIIAGWVISLLAENWPKWHTFDVRIKTFAPMVVSILVAVIATFLGKNTAFVAMVSPFWSILMQAGLTWWATQQAYMTATRSAYATKAKMKSGVYKLDGLDYQDVPWDSEEADVKDFKPLK